MNRFAKRVVIGGIVLIIIGVPAWFLYRAAVPAPTCTDGIQNGAEEGVDCGVAACGVSCPPVVLPLGQQPVRIFRTGATSADILAQLDNPNTIYGVSRVDYTLVVDDASGQQLIARRGFTYVDPMQPRYILFPLTGLTGIPASAQLQFAPTDVQWGTFSVDAATNVQFIVRNETLTPKTDGARYTATVMNRSTFDFDTVDIVILLHNPHGDIVGANTTVAHTLKAGEERAFTADWPFAVPEAVSAESVVTTNLFENGNFIKTYGTQERFQGY
jgi:hypothetical protein